MIVCDVKHHLEVYSLRVNIVIENYVRITSATEMPHWKFRAHSLLSDHYRQT